jgi:hypothetical protein
MPEDLANQVSEELNKNTITPQDTIQDALDDIARDIAIIEADPNDWGGWLIYLIEQMEGEAEKRFKDSDYKSMLITLSQDILLIID